MFPSTWDGWYVSHVVDTKVIQGLGNLDLLLGREKGIGELFALAQGAFDDLEPGDVAQEVCDPGVVAVGVSGSVRVWVFTGLDSGEAFMIWHFGRILSAKNRYRR